MLPQQILAIRDIGDIDSPYWAASSDDGVQLLLEPGESLLYVGYCRVKQISPAGWTLPDSTTVVVTDRRIAFLTRQFDTGGGWSGFGVAGLAVAVTANAVSKRRAAARSAGKVAVGQIRHEWLTGIALRSVKALIGATDTYIDLTCATAAGSRTLELWGRAVVSEDFTRWLVRTVCIHRLAMLPPEQSDARAALQRYHDGGQDQAPTGKPNDICWYFPGRTDDLISAVLSRTPELAHTDRTTPSSQ
jgi:hypothetical protein